LSFKKFDKVLLLDEYKVRRAKLYYIREKVGKAARMKSKITADRRNINIVK
jgi:ribosomal protein L19